MRKKFRKDSSFLEGDKEYQPDELRTIARDYLPDYIIPEEIIFLDSMPLTSNGKIDYKYLKSSAESKFNDAPSENIESRELSETEKKIAEIVCKELKIENVDAETNLYDYGANSLTMAQLAGNIAKLMDSEDAFDSILVQLFDNPTIRSAAELIDEMNNK